MQSSRYASSLGSTPYLRCTSSDSRSTIRLMSQMTTGLRIQPTYIAVRIIAPAHSQYCGTPQAGSSFMYPTHLTSFFVHATRVSHYSNWSVSSQFHLVSSDRLCVHQQLLNTCQSSRCSPVECYCCHHIYFKAKPRAIQYAQLCTSLAHSHTTMTETVA